MSTTLQIEQAEHASERYAQRVNRAWVRLLDLLQMNVRYERCVGVELFTEDGRRILDFLSGYCVHNVGHNHPHVVRALQIELERCGPAMIQTHVADLAGELAEKLCERAGGRLTKAFFASSGSEGVEAAIKFARAHTRRVGILSAEHAFHGLTCGALSLMSDKFWSEGFGPLLQEIAAIPFGDSEALERELKGCSASCRDRRATRRVRACDSRRGRTRPFAWSFLG
jgi:ornithine--oxo-acid transaminase